MKIYTAYKVKDPSKLWKVVRYIKSKTTKNVKTNLRALYSELMDAVDTTSEKYKELYKRYENDWAARHSMAHDVISEGYKKQASQNHRNPFDFDVYMTVREYKGEYYLIPHCDWIMRNVFDFLEKSKYVEDFAYWNNSDMPDNMSKKEWNHRSKIWNALAKNDETWAEYLMLTICSQENFWRVDPWWEDAVKHRKAKQK